MNENAIQIEEGRWKLPQHCSKSNVLSALRLMKAERDRCRRDSATLRARLQERDEECNRWAVRWARAGLAPADYADCVTALGAAPSAPTQQPNDGGGGSARRTSPGEE